MPNLTLWKTLEEQRRQAEEDDRWLEEADDLEEPGPSVVKVNGLGSAMSQLSLNSSPALERVKKSTEAISAAVDQLNNSFNKEMKHETFVEAVRHVTAKLQQLFTDATELLNETDEERRREAEMTEALIGNDMRQMSDAMQRIAVNSQSPVRERGREEDEECLGISSNTSGSSENSTGPRYEL